MALKAEMGAGGGGLPGVVGLECAEGEDAGRAFSQRLAEEVFQLARLVAADAESGAVRRA